MNIVLNYVWPGLKMQQQAYFSSGSEVYFQLANSFTFKSIISCLTPIWMQRWEGKHSYKQNTFKKKTKEINQVIERDRGRLRVCSCLCLKKSSLEKPCGRGTLVGGTVCVQQTLVYLLCPALCLLPRLPRNAQTCPFRHRGKNRNKKKGGSN
jgi:hypothetical protein